MSEHEAGASTSEFKMAVLAVGAGLVLVALGLWKDHAELIATGGGIVGLAVGGYGISRGLRKAGT